MSDAPNPAKPAVPTPHWINPWEDAIPVTLEELAGCHEGLDTYYGDGQGGRVLMTEEAILAHWRSGEKGPLDAYILPCPSGWHSIGIRYGAEGSQYLSPPANRERTAALLRRYQR